MSVVEFVLTESRASLGIDLGIRGLKVSHLSNVQYCTVPTLVCLFIYNYKQRTDQYKAMPGMREGAATAEAAPYIIYSQYS